MNTHFSLWFTFQIQGQVGDHPPSLQVTESDDLMPDVDDETPDASGGSCSSAGPPPPPNNPELPGAAEKAHPELPGSAAEKIGKVESAKSSRKIGEAPSQPRLTPRKEGPQKRARQGQGAIYGGSGAGGTAAIGR